MEKENKGGFADAIQWIFCTKIITFQKYQTLRSSKYMGKIKIEIVKDVG